MAYKGDGREWELLVEDGYGAFMKGQYTRAEHLYRTALAIAERGKSIVSSTYARLYFLMGELYVEKREYAVAESCYGRAVTTYEDVCNYIDASICCRRLSEVCSAQGKASETAQFSKKANKLLVSKRSELEKLFHQAHDVNFDR